MQKKKKFMPNQGFVLKIRAMFDKTKTFARIIIIVKYRGKWYNDCIIKEKDYLNHERR